MGEALSCLYLTADGGSQGPYWAWGQEGRAGPGPRRAFPWPKPRPHLATGWLCAWLSRSPPLSPFSPALNMTCRICSPRRGSHPSAGPAPAIFQFHFACSDSTPTAQRLFPRSPTGVCRPAHPFLLFFCLLSSWLPGQRAEVLKPSPFQHSTCCLPSRACTPTPALTSCRV